MIIRVNESKLKSVISKCVKQALNEGYDDEYNDEYDDERKRAEIDAAWDEFENGGPFATTMGSYMTMNAYRNGNVDVPSSWETPIGLDAQKEYEHNNASNSSDTWKNFDRTYARSLGGNSDTKHMFGLGDYRDWDAAVDDTYFDDGSYSFDDCGRHTTRNPSYTNHSSYSHLSESIRRSVRKAIRKYTR